MTADLAAIRARLAAATPGPWHAWDRGIGCEVHKGSERYCLSEFGTGSEHCDELNDGFRETFSRSDADLIANAPADLAALCDEVEALRPTACDMRHEPPYDFAWCVTHDSTFPLGSKCKFDGREMWEVYAEECDEQRGRAVRAEMRLERAEAAVQRVRELVKDWSSRFGSGSHIEGVMGRQVVSVDFATDIILRALDGAE